MKTQGDLKATKFVAS